MEKIKKINENEVKVDGCVYRKVEEPKPEFKDGDWVHTDRDGDMFRITGISDTGLCSGVGKRDFNSWESTRLRHATKDEIESHLKKICDEKGYKVGVKVEYSCGDVRTMNGYVTYIPDWLSNEDAVAFGNNIIWRSGKGFYPIIPDKKKLPKTKEEFSVFLNKFNGYIDLPFPPEVHSFLKDYE